MAGLLIALSAMDENICTHFLHSWPGGAVASNIRPLLGAAYAVSARTAVLPNSENQITKNPAPSLLDVTNSVFRFSVSASCFWPLLRPCTSVLFPFSVLSFLSFLPFLSSSFLTLPLFADPRESRSSCLSRLHASTCWSGFTAVYRPLLQEVCLVCPNGLPSFTASPSVA